MDNQTVRRGAHIHLDPVGGVAGDMFVAALLDAAPQLWPRVEADLEAVLPHGVSVERQHTMTGGLRAGRFVVTGGTAADAPLSRYGALSARIEEATLTAGTAVHAQGILRRLAEAEAHIHNIPVAQVHFHELADWDTLADVVAAGSIIAAFQEASWSLAPLPMGGGLVSTAHGLLPVPAPATALLLKGFPVRADPIGGERVTPTGAAILAHIAPGVQQGGDLTGVGMGAGAHDIPGMPNILRALILTPATVPNDETVGVLSFAVDDMTGEEIAVAADRLRAMDPVYDVSLAPRLGKKGRPEHLFQLLIAPNAREEVAEASFSQTSTIGLRWR
ncbi:MAG: LarC family nickel insertion protein, partial [Pseudomonadota bacterium]